MALLSLGMPTGGRGAGVVGARCNGQQKALARRSALRRHRRPLRRLTAGLLVYAALALYGLVSVFGPAATQPSSTTGVEEQQHYFSSGRRLLSGGSCDEAYKMWGGEKALVDDKMYIAYIFGILYMFVGIAIICDDYFVGSLEAICEKLELPEDVAGATFMAAGSSAPELFTSLMSLVTNAGNEIGVSAIVGSAVFNVLVIIGGTAMLAGQVLALDWRPVTRDVLFYLSSIGTTVLFMYDGKVWWYEGVISTLLYGLYILTMYRNDKLMDWMATFDKSNTVAPAPADKDGASQAVKVAGTRNPTEGGAVPQPLLDLGGFVEKAVSISKAPGGSDPLDGPGQAFGSAGIVVVLAQRWKRITHGKYISYAIPEVTNGTDGKFFAEKVQRTSVDEGSAETEDFGNDKADDDKEEAEEEEENESPFSPPGTLMEYPLWLIYLPWYALFTATVPDCTKPGWEKWYIGSFVGSIVQIGAISYCMVEWANIVGCAVDAPIAIMGTQVLAAGTSIPDALSSVLVARQGMGDMAVANAVGSNVFDIWLGLGLPWAIMLPFKGGYVELDNTELYPNIGILVGVLIVYYISIRLAKFKLGKALGSVYCGVYLCFTLWNVIGVWYLRAYGKKKD